MQLPEYRTTHHVFHSLPHTRLFLLCALLLLRGAELTHCCYNCFSSNEERTGTCKYVRSLDKMEELNCLQRLIKGFEPLNNHIIPYSQVTKVKMYLKSFDKEVRHIEKSLAPQNWVEQFERKTVEYVKGVQEIISNHPSPDCKPPCGLQKNARKFKCQECTEEECKLPVACPIEDINIIELQRTHIECKLSFTLPKYVTIEWKFASNIRVTDLSYFKKIHSGEDVYLIIQPTRAFHQGTYACEIIDEDEDIIAQKFFFVNVSRSIFNADTKLQEIFQVILKTNITADKEEETQDYFGVNELMKSQEPLSLPTSIVVTAGVALIFMLLTVLVGAGFIYATDVD